MDIGSDIASADRLESARRLAVAQRTMSGELAAARRELAGARRAKRDAEAVHRVLHSAIDHLASAGPEGQRQAALDDFATTVEAAYAVVIENDGRVAHAARIARRPFQLRFARHRGPLSRALVEGPTLVEPAGGNAGAAGVGILAAPIPRPAGTPSCWLCAGLTWPPARPVDELLALAEDFAGLLGMALAVADHEARLEDLADHDFLTGCLSRRGLDDALTREIARCERHAAQLSIAFLDLDHFKRINDDHGHQEGDRVLAGVGRTLQAAARRYDSVCRYGGDELVVVMPDTGREDSAQVASRLVGSLKRAHLDGEGTVDASAGVATWRPNVDGAELVAEADAAMRRAKTRGADRRPSPDPVAGR